MGESGTRVYRLFFVLAYLPVELIRFCQLFNSPEPDPELYLIGMSDMTKEKTLLSEEKCIQQNL
jgi:hypothetical protein